MTEGMLDDCEVFIRSDHLILLCDSPHTLDGYTRLWNNTMARRGHPALPTRVHPSKLQTQLLPRPFITYLNFIPSTEEWR